MSDDETPTSADGTDAGDTFGVGIRVRPETFEFVVHVPSDIESGWADPDEFQRHIEQATWERLDRAATLRTVAETASEGETVALGTVQMTPDTTVVSHTLTAPESGSERER